MNELYNPQMTNVEHIMHIYNWPGSHQIFEKGESRAHVAIHSLEKPVTYKIIVWLVEFGPHLWDTIIMYAALFTVLKMYINQESRESKYSGMNLLNTLIV